MAILVVQLARFGDIFQTWPVLKALRRQHPGADLHLLVRERFQAATDGLETFGVKVHLWPTKSILEPVIAAKTPEAALTEMHARLDAKVSELQSIAFDRIINLSFSPFSSYLTDALRQPATQISGYTRHPDGFLSIPDDSSAYFYAQVGIDRPNRYHLCDIFAAVAGVEYEDADFSHPSAGGRRSNQIIVHLGASQVEKTYPPELWIEALRRLLIGSDASLLLVGSENERLLAEAVAAALRDDRIENRVGQSTLKDLCQWIAQSRLLIGADSAPVHIATLVGTPVLNLSCAQVNFRETGPLVPGSRVLFAEEMSKHHPQAIAETAVAMLRGEKGPWPHFVKENRSAPYTPVHLVTDDFEWRLLQALYTAADYPPLPDGNVGVGFTRLREICDLAIEQLEIWRTKGPSGTITAILESVDEMLHKLPVLDPTVAPVVRWFETERLRLGPSDPGFLLARTRDLFEQLRWIAAVYDPSDKRILFSRVIELSERCARAFREFDGPVASPLFLELTGVLQPMLENQTSVLRRMTEALDRGDWIELADIVQYEIPELVAGPGRGTMESWKPNNVSSS